MYEKMARYYDRIYAFKDYESEAQKLIDAIRASGGPTAGRLLDVACGTGRHLEYLSESYEVEGLDLCPELLEVAQSRNPGMTFHCADMRTFSLPSAFDVITCLFSSIGYMTSLEDLRAAAATMARHLAAGGVLLVEPWFTPDTWNSGTVHGLFVDDPDLKIARVNTSLTKDGLSIMDLHHLVGTPEETFHVVEHHEMGLYSIDQMTNAFESAGLTASYDPDGLTGRGLYIGVR